MIKKKVLRRKNPHLKDIKKYLQLNSVKFKKIGFGVEADVYYFKINDPIIINAELVQEGEYVLKLFRKDITLKSIEYSDILSAYGLIPKIYVITKKYIIMKYIDGKTLANIKDDLSVSQLNYINEKIDNLDEIWRKLGFRHWDLTSGNILISKDLKRVYFIDPFLQ